MDDAKVFRWLLNVDQIWQVPNNGDEKSHSTALWATNPEVKKALELLPSQEQAKVLRFYRPHDAKLSLGSNLLKHKAIVETCNVPWKDSFVGEDSNRKPCYKPSDPVKPTMEFNVSHHGTLVALVGCSGKNTKLGVDIVQMNWEKDYPTVVKGGFENWANTYEMVFSDREIRDIVNYTKAGSSDTKEDIRIKLRHFYAHWCLKEAYIKMTGEALLAPWLKDLEFRDVTVPLAASQLSETSPNGPFGQICNDVEIWFRGSRVMDVKMELQAYNEDYMIGIACSDINAQLSHIRELDVAQDVYLMAGEGQ